MQSITSPAAITDVPNGTAKTAAALGLPATVELVTDNGSMNANVAWNVEASNYDPAVKEEQTFTVDGTVTLPEGVDNPNNVALTTSIQVTVLQASTQPGSTLTGVHQVAPGQTFDVTMGLSGVTESVYQQIYAQDLTLHYDPTNVQFDSVTSLRDEFEVIDHKEIAPGQIRIVAASVGTKQGVSAQGDLLKYKFTVKSEAQETDTTVSVGDVAIANGEGNVLPLKGASHALQISIPVDKSGLNASIASAQAKHDAAVEGNEDGLYVIGSKAQLQSAIDTANAIANDPNTTQQQVDSVKSALEAAV
ncbi:cohesin domain-containing protein, partial [Neobacillus drentensis]|uniref:cohesin domain-containing protein n=1 Tax=Neobacillus drentensis TaxID=220684 RepID=UPI003002112D